MKTFLYSLLLIFTTYLTQGQDVKKAISLYEKNKPTQAKKILKSVSSNDINYANSQFYLGRIAFDEEHFDNARDYFDEAIDVNDANSNYYNWLGNAIGRIAQESNVFQQGFLAPKVKNAYERAVELDPKNIDARWGLVEYYTLAPGFMGGSWEKAEQTAKAISNMDLLQGHNALATVYLRQEKYTLAEKEYVKASKLNNGSVYTLGYFYQNRKSYDKAFEVFEKELKKDPKDMASLYQVGRTSALSGERSQRGLSCIEKYLSQTPKENEPSHAAALMRKAMIYEKIGNKPKAQIYYKQSLAKDPEMKMAKEGLERVSK